jgi:hypothetical protein
VRKSLDQLRFGFWVDLEKYIQCVTAVPAGVFFGSHSVRSKVADSCCSQRFRQATSSSGDEESHPPSSATGRKESQENWNLVSHLGSPPLPDSPLVRIPFAIREVAPWFGSMPPHSHVCHIYECNSSVEKWLCCWSKGLAWESHSREGTSSCLDWEITWGC